MLLTRHPAHIYEQAVHLEEISTQRFFATRCWFRVSISFFLNKHTVRTLKSISEIFKLKCLL